MGFSNSFISEKKRQKLILCGYTSLNAVFVQINRNKFYKPSRLFHSILIQYYESFQDYWTVLKLKSVDPTLVYYKETIVEPTIRQFRNSKLVEQTYKSRSLFQDKYKGRCKY